MKEITSKFSDLNILVIGDIGVDFYSQGEVKRISPEAPVPVLNVEKEWKKLGLAANVAENLSSLGIKCSLLGLSGDDTLADEMKKLAEDSNIEIHCFKDPSRRTILKQRVLAGNQQICRIDYEDHNPFESLEVKEWITSNISKFDGVIIQDYGKGFLTEENLKIIIDECRAHHIFVAVDPSITKDPSVYKSVDLFKPNKKEASFISRSFGKIEIDPDFLRTSLGVKSLVITKGAEGMLISNKNEKKLVPTFSKEVYDVSGAGDTSIAVLTASLVAGSTLEQAATLANIASGLVIQKVGTATIDIEEFKNEVNKL